MGEQLKGKENYKVILALYLWYESQILIWFLLITIIVWTIIVAVACSIITI